MSSPIICECGNKNTQTENALVKPTGKVKLLKLQFITNYYVCRDNADINLTEKDIYALNDGVGNYIHWALEEKLYKDKPTLLPVVIHSKEIFKIKAWFKVEGELKDEPDIAIAFPFLSGYTFKECCKKGKRSGEFDLEFEVNNTPYENIITYQTNFCVSFCYCENNQWIPAGHSVNELYMTWREPEIKSNIFNSINYIQESLLYLSCKQGYKSRGKVNSDWEDKEVKNIADSIFENLRGLNTHRRYETFKNGMGYWRGKSSILGGKGESDGLLIDGEGTCGDWANLLIELLSVQGIYENNIHRFDIETPVVSTSSICLIPKGKKAEIYDYYYGAAPGAKQNQGEIDIDSIQNKAKVFPPDDANNSKDAHILLRNSKHDKTDSANYVDYDEFIPSIFLIKNWDIKSEEITASPPTQNRPLIAQGNNNPVSIFWDHVFVVIKTKDGGYWYDPSYGVKSKECFYDSRKLLNHYTQQTMSGILAAAIPKNKSKGAKMKENASGLYINLFELGGFNPKNNVEYYFYKPIIHNSYDVIIYDYEQYVNINEPKKYTIKLGVTRRYSILHADFRQIEKDLGYKVLVRYYNGFYHYFIGSFNNEQYAREEIFPKVHSIFKDCTLMIENDKL